VLINEVNDTGLVLKKANKESIVTKHESVYKGVVSF